MIHGPSNVKFYITYHTAGHLLQYLMIIHLLPTLAVFQSSFPLISSESSKFMLRFVTDLQSAAHQLYYAAYSHICKF